MIELVHDQRQIHALHSSVIAPGLTQAMCAEVTTQPHLFANGRDDLPGLATPDRLQKTVVLSIEEDEVVLVTDNFRVCCNLLIQCILDTVINHDFLTFATLLFFDPKSPLDVLIVIQEMVNL